MKYSVGLLHEDLVALRKFIPAVQAHLGDFEEKDASKTSTSGEKHQKPSPSSIINSLTNSLPHALYLRRLRAISDAPDVIDGYIGTKRWTEATSVYLRSMKIFTELSRFSSSQPGSSVYEVSIQASDYIAKQKAAILATKGQIIRGARTFLARAKLFHRVALEDNLQNSADVARLLQEWKIQLEEAKDVKTSLLLKMLEPSVLRPIAGVSASLDHCSNAFSSALASLSLLDDLAPAQLFRSFLTLRLTTMKHIVKLATNSKEFAFDQFETLNFALGEWIRSIQWTVYLINAMFMHQDASGDKKTTNKVTNTKSNLNAEKTASLPLLNLICSAMIARQFGSSLESAATCVSEAVLANLKNSLDSTFIHSETLQWISECMSLLPGALPYEINREGLNYAHTQSVLAPIKSGKDLAHLESSIAYQIDNPLVKYAVNEAEQQHLFSYPTSSPTWSGATTPNSRSGSTTPRSGASSSFWTSPSSHHSTPNSVFGGMSASALLASAQLTKWKTVSSRVCGRSIDLWTTFFHNLFLFRAQYIIEISFSQISLEARIQPILNNKSRGAVWALSADEAAPLPYHDLLSNPIVDESVLGEYIWATGEYWNAHKVETQLDHAHALTPALKAIIATFDTTLRNLMDDLRPLLTIEDELASQAESDSESTLPESSGQETPVVRRRYRASSKEETLPILRAETQEKCVSLVSRLSEELSHQVELLTSESNPKQEMVSNIHKAIFLGRLSRVLDTHSTQLRMILWQLEWTPRHSRGTTLSVASMGSGNARITGPKWLDRMSRKPLASIETLSGVSSTLPAISIKHSAAVSASFQTTYHLAYSKWVNIVTQELADYLSELIQPPAHTTTPLRHGWANINVGASLQKDMLVPSQPSANIMRWLREIVALIYRAGAHNVDRFVLEYLVYCVSQAAHRVLEQRVAALKLQSAWERDWSIQFWFDLRFVFDVLSRRALNNTFFKALALESKGQASHSKWDDVAEAMAFSGQIESLIASLKAKLDPVEASFYAPHITTQVKSAIGQYTSMFGLLMAKTLENQKRSNSVAFTTPVDASAASTMPCVQNAPRFATLPVSTLSITNLREQMHSATSPHSSSSSSSPSHLSQVPEPTAATPTSTDTSAMPVDLSGRSRQALEAAGAFWGKLSEGVKGNWFS
jgi:hypothetical protein